MSKRDWRREHEIACQALEVAKERADESYQIPDRGILFKKIQKDGRLRVGFKDFSGGGHFKMVPMKEVEAMGVDIYSLPEYTEFSKEFYKLQHAAQKFFYDARNRSRQALREARSQSLNRFYQERREIYDSYMASPEWAAKRQQCYQVHGTTCVDCQSAHATDIHHRHYKTLGDECPKNDIVPLCSSCHKARHDSGDLENAPKKYAYGNAGVEVGRMVEHPRFGNGLVVEMDGGGKMARVKVNFCDSARWLVLAYAPLRLVG